MGGSVEMRTAQTDAVPDSDPITAGGERVFQSKMRCAAGHPHRTMERAGHLLHVDAGPLLADTMAAWMG